MSVRVAPGGIRDLGVINWTLCRAISLAAGVPEAHLFTTLGRQRSLFRSWLMFSAGLMPFGRISRHETEVVILRVAHLRGCLYERDHHVRIGKRAGITAELLEQIERGPDSPQLSARKRALLACVDDLVQHKNISDPHWKEMNKFYDSARLVELCLLVGQYEMLATTIATLHIERDF